MILHWAVITANAMRRTLILPCVAHHSNYWQNFNKQPSSDVVSMGKVLDVEALSASVFAGVRVWNDTMPNLELFLSHRSWFRFRKPQSKVINGVEKDNYWGDWFIRQKFSKRREDFVYWNKNSMWKAAASDARSRAWLNKHITFHKHLKALASALSTPLGDFNAIHVRRNDHIGGRRSDRSSPEAYYKRHRLRVFNKSIPLYIATDEKNRSWFERFKRFGFKRLVFWDDLPNKELLTVSLSEHYPIAVRSDVLGFVEQLVCARASGRFEGSIGSTFSYSITQQRRDAMIATRLDYTLPSLPKDFSRYMLP